MKTRHMFLVVVCLLLVSGCVKKELKKVSVQYINASYNSPYVGFYLQGSERMSLVGYTNCTNSHTADLEDGEPLLIEVKDPATGNLLSKLSYGNWKEGTHYTVVTYGDYTNVKTALFGDTAALAGAGKLKVRFMHFSPDAPALDILYNGQLVDSNRVFYGTDSTNAIGGFVELNAATYNIQLKEHNTGTVLADIPAIGFSDNRILDVYATGTIADTLNHHISLGWAAH